MNIRELRRKKHFPAYLLFGSLLACCIFLTVFYIPVCAGGEESFYVRYGGSFGHLLSFVLMTGFFTGIDFPWAMIIMSVVAITGRIGEAYQLSFLSGLNEYSFGIFELLPVSIFFLIWFGLPLLLKAFQPTYSAGLALENALNKLNAAMLLIVELSFALGFLPAGMESWAAYEHAAAGDARSILSGIFVLFVILASMLVFFVIRMLFSFFDIILLPVCSVIPFVSFFYVLLKLGVVLIGLLFFLFLPFLFWFFFVCILLAAIMLFRLAFYANRYFRDVYIKGMWAKLKGYDRNIPLVREKIPAKLREYMQGKEPELLIPVYLLKKLPFAQKSFRWDKWWLLSDREGVRLVRPEFLKSGCRTYPLVQQNKIFYNNALPYLEVFTLAGNEADLSSNFKRIPKMLHFVFSKEYSLRSEEIIRKASFVDYQQYRTFVRQAAANAGPCRGKPFA